MKETSRGLDKKLGDNNNWTAKTLMAQMVANDLKLPVLKFEVSQVMHSHVGQSERNMADAVNMIKACSPCVLFIDEIEKTLSGTASSNKVDGGTLMRVFGQLLELLSSEEGDEIFTIMTSNDISALPPELTRSGRLDTIWYFGLPNEEERKEIFNIHFRLKNKVVSDEIIAEAASNSDKLTGAEIKEVVKTSIRKAFNRTLNGGSPEITVEDVLSAKEEIIPVSVSYAEKIKALEVYTETRARHASATASRKKTQEVKGLFDL